ncbi:MAG: hypothetical protein ACJAWS_000803 [Oleiphilaceae bacterium]|jgi:hypothetical protein
MRQVFAAFLYHFLKVQGRIESLFEFQFGENQCIQLSTLVKQDLALKIQR